MVRGTNDDGLDLFYSNAKQNKNEKISRGNKKNSKNKRNNNKNTKNKRNNNKNTKNVKKINKKDTKDEKFSFDNEIIIGLRKIDEDVDKPKNKKTNKTVLKDKKTKKKNKVKKLTPEEQKKKERAKKKRKAIFRTTKWLVFFAIIIVGAVYAILSPIFNIKQINVSGNSKISSSEIISLSGLENEQNMFKYKMSDARERIKENAYIDTVKIKRNIPDSVNIEVTERQASFAIAYANAYALISSQGYILEISKQNSDLPILTGIKTKSEEIQPGKRLCSDDLKRLR